jgi:hypothetical protein
MAAGPRYSAGGRRGARRGRDDAGRARRAPRRARTPRVGRGARLTAPERFRAAAARRPCRRPPRRPRRAAQRARCSSSDRGFPSAGVRAARGSRASRMRPPGPVLRPVTRSTLPPETDHLFRPPPRPFDDPAAPVWSARLVGTTSAAARGSAAEPPPAAGGTGRRAGAAAGTARHPAAAFPAAAALPAAVAHRADRRPVDLVSRAPGAPSTGLWMESWAALEVPRIRGAVTEGAGSGHPHRYRRVSPGRCASRASTRQRRGGPSARAARGGCGQRAARAGRRGQREAIMT